MKYEYRELTVEEVEMAMNKFNMKNPMYRGICPICGKAVIENEYYDCYVPEVLHCINCYWNTNEFESFEDMSGITNKEERLIHSAILDRMIDINYNTTIEHAIRYCFRHVYNDLGNALMKYYIYKIKTEEYNRAYEIFK